MTSRQLTITDLPAGESSTEALLDGQFEVRSRSGLHPTELALAAVASRFQSTGLQLVSGNRTGVLPMVLATLSPAARITTHDFDVHHVRAVARNLKANGFGDLTGPEGLPRQPFCTPTSPIALACTAHLPITDCTRVWLQAASGCMATELLLDWLEEVHAALTADGVCLVAVDGPIAWTQNQLKRLFGPVSVLPPVAGARVLVARKTLPLRRQRNFEATFPATLPGGTALTLTTIPGVFAHRRPDAGGLALAEVAARMIKPGDRLLDLGCGCGLVGLTLARHTPLQRAVLVDSDARAFACTQANAIANNCEPCEVVLSDAGVPRGEGFTLVVGNPPYYSDYSISERFIRTAADVLLPGGSVLIVARSAARHAELMTQYIGPARIERRRGYHVVIAQRT